MLMRCTHRLKATQKKTRNMLTVNKVLAKWCQTRMKLREQIKKLPVGKVISVDPKAMTLVRYHARGCRDIISRVNLSTGKRDVLLGDFYRQPEAIPK